jgi:hypothetical protein
VGVGAGGSPSLKIGTPYPHFNGNCALKQYSTSTAKSLKPNGILSHLKHPSSFVMDSSANNAASGRPAGNAAPNNNNPNRDTERTPYAPRLPQKPKLSVTYNGGQALPNSEAEMAAAISQSGNGNYNNDSNPDDPDESAQHRERARSPQGSQLLSSKNTANPIGLSPQF